MLGVKNLRVVAAGLCLGATLLSGCGDDIVIKNDGKKIILNYEEEIPNGKISYDCLDKYVKIVKFTHNNTYVNRLIIENKIKVASSPSYYDIRYIDLKSGITIINYMDYCDDNTEFIIGGELNIVEETCITNYLLQQDFIKGEYEVSEILDFYQEKILPILDSSEKELVK